MITSLLKAKDPGTPSPVVEGLLPEIVLEVAFDSDPTDEVQVFTTVSSDSVGKQLEFSVKRGRQDELKTPETGTLVTTLFNQDRDFDPTYTLSPYFPKVLPVKQVRLSAVWAGFTYPLFRGDIEQWPQKWAARSNQAIIQGNDGFDALSQVQVEVTRPEEFTGSRINAILDAAEWPVSQRNIQAGKTLLHPNTYSGTALELIKKVAQDEDAYFFMDGSGRTAFIERHARFKPPYTTPAVTLSNRPSGSLLPLSDSDVQVDKDFIKNQVQVKVEAVVETSVDSEGQEVQVTISDEVEFFKEDADSKRSYRPRSLVFDGSAIANLNEAQTKAEYHLERLKDPKLRVKKVVLEPQLNSLLWPHALGREIGDRIGLQIYPPQVGTEEVISFEGIIEYVEHKCTVRQWQTTWYLSPADLNDYWILGDTVLGVLDTTTKVGY